MIKLTVTTAFAGLMLMGSAFAQDAAPATTTDAAQDMTIGAETIPADQIPAVEDWCKELQAQQGLTGTQEPESTMTEEQTETVAGDQDTAAADAFDVSTVTLEMCQEAGLTDIDGD